MKTSSGKHEFQSLLKFEKKNKGKIYCNCTRNCIKWGPMWSNRSWCNLVAKGKEIGNFAMKEGWWGKPCV